MSLANVLPAPQHQNLYVPRRTVVQNVLVDPNSLIPPYGARSNYVPRKPEDYGDGGAFPEIGIRQYPLNMGRKKK